MSFERNDIIDRAIGDAMGIPFENLTPEQIAEIQKSINKDESLFVNVAGRNPYVSKDWPTGRWGNATVAVDHKHCGRARARMVERYRRLGVMEPKAPLKELDKDAARMLTVVECR